MEKSRIGRQVIAAVIVTSAASSGGFQNAWPSPSLVKLQAENSDLPVTSDQGAWIVTAYAIGSLLGALLTIIITNKWGRKLTLLSTSIPTAAGCIMIATAKNHWWLIAARFVSGLGVGGAMPISLMYLAEIASDRIRGAVGVLDNQMKSIGVLLTYCIGPWTSRVGLAYVGLALPIIFAIPFIWMPESPYFLVMRNRKKDAEKSLVWLRGSTNVEGELKKVEESIRNEVTGTLKELIVTPGNRKALMIITMLMVGPQLSGINAFLAYSGLIFEASGSELSSSVSLIIMGVIQLITGWLSVFVVDLAGRRPLLLLSFGGSIAFLLAEALYFQLQAVGVDVSSISWLPMVAMIGYLVSYSFGLGCIPFVVLSEILPCNFKTIGMTYAMCVASFSVMAIMKLYQVIADAYGIHASFYVFAVSATALALCVYLFLPETKQKCFSDIQGELRGSADTAININA